MSRAGKPAESQAQRRQRGFEPAGALLAQRIRTGTEKRGFAVARLLTHWADIAGPELAGNTRPVKVTYGADGFGATLVLLVRGAVAPMVEAALPALKDRVNACYGYGAVRHIRLTQVSGDLVLPATGSADKAQAEIPNAFSAKAAQDLTRGIGDATLREALEALGQRILTRSHNKDNQHD